MLINRATLRTADYSGTCAFRRSAFLRVGPYDGDVLFDNEEMIRHFARAGLKIDYRADCFVQKKPPSFRKWLEQRPRQAYEDFALRVKTVSFASIIPVGIALAVFWPVQAFSLFSALIAAVSIALALAGWSRGEARKCFPIVACLFAPFWILERAVSTYCAFGWYLFRGGYPFAGRVLSRGVGRDWFAVRDSGPKTELNFGSGDHVLSGEEKQRCRATKRGFGRLNRGGAFVS
jgi:hypothetical protein